MEIGLKVLNQMSYLYLCSKNIALFKILLLDIVVTVFETSTPPSCSGPLPTQNIKRHLVPAGAVNSFPSELHFLKNQPFEPKMISFFIMSHYHQGAVQLP